MLQRPGHSQVDKLWQVIQINVQLRPQINVQWSRVVSWVAGEAGVYNILCGRPTTIDGNKDELLVRGSSHIYNSSYSRG